MFWTELKTCFKLLIIIQMHFASLELVFLKVLKILYQVAWSEVRWNVICSILVEKRFIMCMCISYSISQERRTNSWGVFLCFFPLIDVCFLLSDFQNYFLSYKTYFLYKVLCRTRISGKTATLMSLGEDPQSLTTHLPQWTLKPLV